MDFFSGSVPNLVDDISRQKIENMFINVNKNIVDDKINYIDYNYYLLNYIYPNIFVILFILFILIFLLIKYYMKQNNIILNNTFDDEKNNEQDIIYYDQSYFF